MGSRCATQRTDRWQSDSSRMLVSADARNVVIFQLPNIASYLAFLGFVYERRKPFQSAHIEQHIRSARDG